MQISESTPELNEADPKRRKDTILKTIHYRYEKFIQFANSNAEFRLNFGVKAYSNAHILFTPTKELRDSTPVYEIVLGADHNRHCSLRRRQQGCEKIKVDLENIVSGDQWRWFWIKISSKGLIEVGKDGNELPFMLWEDPHPLNIEYCSFSSWENTAALWCFECSSNNINLNKSDSEDLMKKLSVMNLNLYDYRV
ncbi:C3 and PZP-like alpha-2-macroglobulin domain-containing protein 8 [Planococcus citri]|uniref:C3 and PZP-like alpha-2-macroglobulin domain-containing protein 8 n=1 Tax=Planococcus citri TaxID=170843 RepID=UPI0031F73E26